MDPDTDTTRAKYAHNRKVMFGSAILLFLILLVIVFYHACRHAWVRRRRRRRHLFTPPVPTDSFTASNFSEGLDPSLLKFLPIFTFSSATHRQLQDCAVCLSEFADGDAARLLPNCDHAFHSHCIDTWFRSHSNCPLCRAPVHQPAAPVQPLQATPPTASSNIEPRSVPEAVQMEEGQVGCSSFPAIGCPVKPIGIIVELPEAEDGDERMRGSDPASGDHGLKGRIIGFCH